MKTVYIVMSQDMSSPEGAGFVEKVFANEEKAKEYCNKKDNLWYEEYDVEE